MHIQDLFQMLRYLLATNSIDVTAEDFNYNLLKMAYNKILNIFTDHDQTLNKPAHIFGSFIDSAYIRKALMEEDFTNITVENIFFFSDYDAVEMTIEKTYVDFHSHP